MVSPWVVIFILLGIIPLVWGFYLSLTNYSGFNFDQLRFLGAFNYESALQDSAARTALLQTVLIVVIYVPLNTALGLVLALLMNTPIHARGVFRTIFYLPAIVPTIVTGLMWQTIFAYRGGLLNQFLAALRLSPIDWEGYRYARLSLLILLLWGAGGTLLINLAGLRAIPRSLYEAAEIDGANAFRRLMRITIPLLTPVLLFNVIMGVIGSFQIFVQPILLTPGSNGLTSVPINPIYLYLNYSWIQLFSYNAFGYGLALLWILFLFILILTILLMFSSRYWVYSEVSDR